MTDWTITTLGAAIHGRHVSPVEVARERDAGAIDAHPRLS